MIAIIMIMIMMIIIIFVADHVNLGNFGGLYYLSDILGTSEICRSSDMVFLSEFREFRRNLGGISWEISEADHVDLGNFTSQDFIYIYIYIYVYIGIYVYIYIERERER